MSFGHRLSVLVLFLVSISNGQRDPLDNFCRLHGHSTTIVDREMIIDGGFVNWAPISAESTNYTSTWLKSGHLDDSNDGFPRQFKLDKNETVPSTVGGVLWADEANKIVYQYGGEYGNGKPEDFRLWSYDVAYKIWNISNVSTSDTRRASWGAGAVDQDKGIGYYYGGWLTNASVPGYNSRTVLKNMLVYDMLGNSFRNQSGPDDVPRAEGVMLYIPAGDSGLLVYFGGIQTPFNNNTVVASPMTDIYIYDIANVLWYKQTASGDDIPGNRRRFCAGAAWAEDRSSYNIYLFGGASIGEGVGYGDVWVLSLPSFKWIKFWPREGDGEGKTFPHHSLSCDVIGNSQMIIMGGHFTNITDCDVPTIQGQHGLDLGKSNAENAKWAKFDPKLTTYKVPSEIAQTIGGGASGGATVLAPTSGWADRDLQTLLGRQYTPTTRTPTRSLPSSTGAASTPSNSGSSGPSKATIGGAVGGGVGGLLLLVAVGVGICTWRRKKRSRPKSPPPPPELHSQPMSPLMPNETKIPSASPSQMVYASSHPSHYTLTPQGMSPLPSPESAWSPHGNAAPAYPGSPGQTVYAAPVAYSYPHSRSPSDHSHYYHPSMHSSPGPPHTHSPTVAVQELPTIRSPAGFNAEPQMQSLDPSRSESWFAQNPPRDAGNGAA
ncbi:unnamed protein product [Periconia digitata]|uniref:Kelch repeat-containing protein n=1 Tax=Periconia digitata TaxID=1303443 RepID=A0A9W4XW64_9PLEO|nr:unnamed protein product [Periconia digitata]